MPLSGHQRLAGWGGAGALTLRTTGPSSRVRFFLKIYLFTFGCSGSSLLLRRFSSLASGATLGCGARASHCKVRSIGSRVRRRQQSRCTGSAAPRHVGSSPTRDRTRVSCTGRRILYHRVSREVLEFILTVFPDSGQAMGWDIAVLVWAHYQCLSPAAPCSPSEAQAGWLLVVLSPELLPSSPSTCFSDSRQIGVLRTVTSKTSSLRAQEEASLR